MTRAMAEVSAFHEVSCLSWTFRRRFDIVQFCERTLGMPMHRSMRRRRCDLESDRACCGGFMARGSGDPAPDLEGVADHAHPFIEAGRDVVH
jgi:hypothetical protein